MWSKPIEVVWGVVDKNGNIHVRQVQKVQRIQQKRTAEELQLDDDVMKAGQSLANSIKVATSRVADEAIPNRWTTVNQKIAYELLYNVKTNVRLHGLDDFSEHPLLFSYLGFLCNVTLSSLQDIVFLAFSCFCDKQQEHFPTFTMNNYRDPFFLFKSYLEGLFKFVDMPVTNMWMALCMGRMLMVDLYEIPADAPFHWGVFQTRL